MERKEKINTKFFGRGNLKETYQSWDQNIYWMICKYLTILSQ
jgi:hypothetical protein